MLFLFPWFYRWGGTSHFPVLWWLEAYIYVTFHTDFHPDYAKPGSSCYTCGTFIELQLVVGLPGKSHPPAWQCQSCGKHGSWPFWSSSAETTRSIVLLYLRMLLPIIPLLLGYMHEKAAALTPVFTYKDATLWALVQATKSYWCQLMAPSPFSALVLVTLARLPHAASWGMCAFGPSGADPHA